MIHWTTETEVSCKAHDCEENIQGNWIYRRVFFSENQNLGSWSLHVHKSGWGKQISYYNRGKSTEDSAYVSVITQMT